MGIIVWLIVGLGAGLLAKTIVRDEGPGGVAGDAVVGIAGALIGGLLYTRLGHSGISTVNLWGILVAFIGSALLLVVLRSLMRPRPM